MVVVLIAGGGASNVRVIEHDPQDVRANRPEHLDGTLRGVPTRVTVTEDEDDAFHARREHQGIADPQHRRGVDHDVGEPLPERGQGLRESRREQESAGLVGTGPAGITKSPGIRVGRMTSATPTPPTSRSDRPGVSGTPRIRGDRDADVGVHQQHVARPELRQGDRAVRRDRGLAILLLERRDHHGLRRAPGVAYTTLVRRLRNASASSELVASWATSAKARGAGGPGVRSERPAVEVGLERGARRHQAESRDAQEGLDFPGVPDARVQVLEEEREGDAPDQAHQHRSAG